jgi:hypothetical protein
MWSDPDQLRSACVNWAAGRTDGQAWCDSMTRWMQNRASKAGGWGPWMMRPGP